MYTNDQSITVHGRFFNEAGVATNPGTVTLTLTRPDGSTQTLTTPAVAHPAVGHYTYTFVPGPTNDGVWTYLYDGDGVPNVSGVGYLLVGAGPRSGPCEPWTDLDELRACDRCPDTDDGVLLDAATGASELLFMLSGRRYPGICVATTRPQPGCACGPVTADLSRFPPYGDFRGCGCCGDLEMGLGPWPVLGVFEVLVDGTALPASAWVLVDRRTLVRTDGGTWPCCQSLSADPTTDAGTIRVRFAYGQDPPALGRRAAAALACELARDCAGQDCQADERVIQKVRQGVTVQLKMPGDLYDAQGNVRLGVRAADLFLSAYGAKRRASIASPDLPRARRVS